MEGGYSQDHGEFSQSQVWNQNCAWMSEFSQPQYQQVSHSLCVPSPFAAATSSNPTYYNPLGMSSYRDAEVEVVGGQAPNFAFRRNLLMQIKEEESIAAAAKALAGNGTPSSPPTGATPPVPIVFKKRGSIEKKAPAKKKGKKSKTSTKKKDVIELGESGLDGEGAASGVQSKWKDCEVETLIQICGEMDDEFVRTAKKQGVNTWLKLQTRVAAGIRGFNRSWESCKKKYKVVYTEYKNDKRANEILGSDRQQECKFFDLMDMWNSSRASVKNQIPASASEWTHDEFAKQGTPQSECIRDQGSYESPQIQPKQEKKTKTSDKLEGILEQVVANSSTFLNIFQESTTLLKNMDRHMAAILEKL